MKKYLFLAFGLACVTAVFAADKVSKLGNGIILNVGGTSSTTGQTAVLADSPTNQFVIIKVTATVAGAVTASTNTFGTAFIAAPTVVAAFKDGASGTTSGLNHIVPTATTTTLIVTGMNSAGTTNTLPFIVYGYQSTGTFN